MFVEGVPRMGLNERDQARAALPLAPPIHIHIRSLGLSLLPVPRL